MPQLEYMKKEKPMIRRAEFCICGTALGYSLMGLTLKLIDCNPFVLNGMERLVCLLILGLNRGSFRIRWDRKTVPGALFMYLSATLFVVANRLTTAANAVILQYTNPIFVIAFSWIFLHRKAKPRDLVLALVMMCDIVLFFVGDLTVGSGAGNMAAILSGVAMALSNMYAHHSGVDVREYAMNSCVISIAVGTLAFAWDPPQLTAVSVGAIAFYGVCCSAIPVILMAKGAPLVEPLKISMLMMIEPVCGPLWVAIAVHETPKGSALIGAAVVLGCLVLNLVWERLEQRRTEKLQIEEIKHGDDSDSGRTGL